MAHDQTTSETEMRQNCMPTGGRLEGSNASLYSFIFSQHTSNSLMTHRFRITAYDYGSIPQRAIYGPSLARLFLLRTFSGRCHAMHRHYQSAWRICQIQEQGLWEQGRRWRNKERRKQGRKKQPNLIVVFGQFSLINWFSSSWEMPLYKNQLMSKTGKSAVGCSLREMWKTDKCDLAESKRT